jgi:hypothetical protein
MYKSVIAGLRWQRQKIPTLSKQQGLINERTYSEHQLD